MGDSSTATLADSSSQGNPPESEGALPPCPEDRLPLVRVETVSLGREEGTGPRLQLTVPPDDHNKIIDVMLRMGLGDAQD